MIPALRTRFWVWLIVIFVISRAALLLAGARFNLELNWMFLADPADLSERLLPTVWQFHAFPPGMNVLAGLLLKLAPEQTAALAHAVFCGFGLMLTLSTYRLGTALGLSPRASFSVAALLSVSPPTLYLENLFLYDYPSAALICACLALAEEARVRSSVAAAATAFAFAAALVWLRSAFHLVWFFAFVAWVVVRAEAPLRRRLVATSLLPASLATLLYAKNAMLFGVPNATSWSGANVTAITTATMDAAARDDAVARGVLSPFTQVSAFSGPLLYRPLVDDAAFNRFPELGALERPTFHAPNFNHGVFIAVNRQRGADARAFVRLWPGQYLSNVFTLSLPQFLSSTTTWHPRDSTPGGPHTQIRSVLGPYERAWNALFHGGPLAPVGLYALTPFVLIAAAWRARRQRAPLLLVALLHIGSISGASVFLSFGECARYRFMIEPLVWLVVVREGLALIAWIRVARRES